MESRSGARQNPRQVRKALKITSLAALAGFLTVSSPLAAGEVSPEASDELQEHYDRSGCAEIDRACRVLEGGSVQCDRPAFVRGMLSCVDLWEAERLCAEGLASTQALQSVDLAGLEAELELAEQARERARRREVWYLVLGLAGWVAATVAVAVTISAH